MTFKIFTVFSILIVGALANTDASERKGMDVVAEALGSDFMVPFGEKELIARSPASTKSKYTANIYTPCS